MVGRKKQAKNNLPRKTERSKPDFWAVGEEILSKANRNLHLIDTIKGIPFWGKNLRTSLVSAYYFASELVRCAPWTPKSEEAFESNKTIPKRK